MSINDVKFGMPIVALNELLDLIIDQQNQIERLKAIARKKDEAVHMISDRGIEEFPHLEMSTAKHDDFIDSMRFNIEDLKINRSQSKGEMR